MLTVFDQIATLVSAYSPAIVEDNIIVAEVAKPVVNHVLRCGKQQAFVNVAVKGVPIVPSHLRDQVEPIV